MAKNGEIVIPELQELLDLQRQHEDRLAESRSLYERLEDGQKPERVVIAPGSASEQFNVLKLGTSMGDYRSDPETPVENIHYAYSVVKEYT